MALAEKQRVVEAEKVAEAAEAERTRAKLEQEQLEESIEARVRAEVAAEATAPPLSALDLAAGGEPAKAELAVVLSALMSMSASATAISGSASSEPPNERVSPNVGRE